MFPQIFGKYVLEREIAAGGMARVYLATLRGAVGFEKRLVVKQIRTELASDDAFVTRFVEEAKTAVELSHPNIVPVYELGVEQGVYYIAMELCEGLTLSEILAETGPLGPAEGAYVGAEICRALDYAHRRANIVHRDVTPRNVLIDDEGAVRLIDFGIAAPVSRADDITRTEVFGSPGHMPPEQLNGAELSPATDVFAVGVLLIEAWTGCPPFRRATAKESEHALFQLPAPVDRQQPQLAPLSALIASSVALDARERPSGAEHLARPLREFLKSEDSGDIARRLAARVLRARRRSRSSSPWLPGELATGQIQQTRPLSPETSPGLALSAGGNPPVTRTFAAHEDVEAWTRKLSSAPEPGLLHTRALASGAERGLADETAEGEAAREPSGSSSSMQSISPRGNAWLALLAACSVVFVALSFVGQPRVAAPQHAGVPQHAVRVRESQGVVPLSLERAAPVAATPSATPARTVVATTKGAGQSTKPPKNDNNDEARLHTAWSDASEQFGLLKITADPGALADVTGAHFHQQGQTPILGLKVPAGKYQIVFRNATIGTAASAQVMVVAGGNCGVHADFRQVEPTVSVR